MLVEAKQGSKGQHEDHYAISFQIEFFIQKDRGENSVEDYGKTRSAAKKDDACEVECH